MLNKIYVFLKRFIKNNYKYLITLILLFTFLNFPLNYSIMVSGGTINLNDRISISNSYNSKGSFNMAYVTEIRSTIPTVLLSYVIPSWTKVPLEDYKISQKESVSDIETRSKILLEYSKQAAIKVSYEKAGWTFNITDDKLYVIYVSEDSETDIKIGDIIKTIDGKKVNDLNFSNIINNYNYGDKVNIEVLRNDKLIKTYATIKQIDNKKMMGISVLNLYDYSITPKIDVMFNNNESGSSGGLMMSLAIYDKLVKKDLTNGKKIVGTGTIDFDGSIGQIDGVEYKLKGAVKDNADIFIAPSGKNYEECLKLKKKNKYKIKIIEAKTFDDVVSELG